MASDAAPVPIDVKVKTLNSQTHDFSVQNDMTVRQFKEHIAETVNIQPDLQRIIYRGRILNDGIQLKEYDMHGKVVHLVERPPPGPGGPDQATGSGADNPQPNTTPGTGRRRVFIHRGANGQPTGAGATGATTGGAPPNLSSTLCLNRITVARHMLTCAQNIINHMDNPQLPLDNSPMDLLVQETLDTTVVEVGISTISDADHVQDIMHAFRGAVNAFHHGGGGGGGADDSEGNIDLNSSNASTTSSSASSLSSSFDPAEGGAASSVPMDRDSQPATAPPPPPTITDGDEGAVGATADGETASGESATTGAAPNGGRGAAGGGGAANQQTTSPRVLGEVVEEMRNVQRRLEPHLQRYYDILMNEPTYSPEETTRREDDQREFDRVSEALHYMSHAQHAISDLMLDLSSASPRHLCCRPILIEHSAFVNTGLPPPTGDILLAMGGIGAPAGGFQFTVPFNGDPPMATAPATGGTAAAGATVPPSGGSAPGTPRRVPTTRGPVPPTVPPRIPGGHHHHHHHMATIPILVQQTHNGLPTMEQLHQSAAAAAAALNSNGIHELIQSIVSAAPMATIEVQRGNEPPITINVPPQAPQAAAAAAPPNPTAASDPLATNEQQNQSGANAPNGRTTSATTMPTTSTQTRSTARPQVHVASIQQPNEMRGQRPFSSSAFSAFDRYLPCNSHHVRNQQARAAGGQATGQAVGGGAAAGGRENVIRIPHGRIEIPIGFPFPLRRPTSSNVPSASQERQSGTATPSSTASARSVTPSDDLDAVYNSVDPDEEFVNGIREDLNAFIVARFFNHLPITVENIKEGVSEIVIGMEELLAPISSYEHPHLCIRLSVLELLRTHLQEILNLLRRDEESDEAVEQRFASNLIRSIRQLASRLSRILLQSNRRRQEIRQLFRGIFVKFVKDSKVPSLARLCMFALKVCLQTVDTRHEHDITGLMPFFVYKSKEASPMEVEESEVATSVSALNQDVNMESQPSTSGGGGATASASTTTSRPILTRLRWDSECEDYPEPAVVAPWHANVPSGWLGTLASDVEEQKKITDSKAQPLSDAYLEGMSKKRRKTITDARPSGSVAETIGANVRQVIQSSGFQADTPVDQIASQISSDVGLQSSYRESMNASIRERLRTDPNYDPKKYSNAEKYFK